MRKTLVFLLWTSFSITTKAQTFTGNLTLTTQAQVDAFNYTNVTGIIFINSLQSSITNLNGLSELTSVGGSLFIDNSHITNLDGLSNLTTVGQKLSISTRFVTSLDALSNLTSANSIDISDNDALTNLDGLSNITSLFGELVIEDNPLLSSLDGLSNLIRTGDFKLIENPLITNLDALSSLKFVVGNFSIEHMSALTNVDGLSSLEGVANLRILSTGLTNLDGLFNLTDIDGLSLLLNFSLANIDGLSGVTKISGHVFIQNNSLLTDIDGLSNLTEIEGNLGIENNHKLLNLDGLVKLASVEGNLEIKNNDALVDFCGLTKLFTSGTILGTVSIVNNGANTVFITPPADIILNNDPGLCSKDITAVVSTIATVTGCLNPSPPSRSDYPPGNIFYVGTTKIVWSVMDGAGNTATAVQNVIITDNEVPVITQFPTDIAVVCAADVPGANIDLVTATDNCSVIVSHVGDVVTNQTCANRFSVTRTYKATDASGNSISRSQIITVNDNVPPQITGLSTSKQILAPPNHKMQDITVNYTITDNCVSSPNSTISVTSNEPVNGTGDGDTDPDWEIIDDHHIRLRAERSATGSSRVYTITITANDGCNAAVTSTAQVIVAHNITGPHSGNSFKVGSTVAFSGEFWDVPSNKHTAKWLIDDNTTVKGIITEPILNKNGKVTGSYKFTAPGVYKLQMNTIDQNNVTTYANTNGDLEAIVVIFDPNGGNTYGGGYFNSPAGALRSDPSATGKASYGFAMNYFKNSTNPKGETQFEFKVGEFEFNALNFDYLVISNSMAQFKGTGKIIGGQSGVGFTMTVTDGQLDGTGVDKIRMKIYNKNNGSIIYDNQFGASDATLPTQAVGANSIIVISGTNSSLTSVNTSQKAEMETNAPKVSNGLDVSAFPNPSASNFTIFVKENSKTDKITMQVIDMYGRIIETRNVNANSMIRFGDRYFPGTYVVRILQGQEHKELKLIKLSD
jgi:hypothetical protein